MTQVTVKQLADEVKTPVERLLQQMREAGLPHNAAEQNVTDSEKQALLTHLKSSHKAKVEEPRKITLQRAAAHHRTCAPGKRPCDEQHRPCSGNAQPCPAPRTWTCPVHAPALP